MSQYSLQVIKFLSFKYGTLVQIYTGELKMKYMKMIHLLSSYQSISQKKIY